MLSPAEEDVLRQIARDRMPMAVTNPNHIDPRGDNESAHAAGKYVDDQFRRAGTLPMTVYGGDTRGMKTPFIEPAPDYDFENRIRHVLKGRPTLQFIAETGLSSTQARTMSKEAITAFVAQAERNAQEEWSPDRKPWSHDPVEYALEGNVLRAR